MTASTPKKQPRQRKAKAQPKPPAPMKNASTSAAALTNERIEQIAYEMIRGEWSIRRRGELAKEWGVTLHAMTKLAKRASVRLELADGELRQEIGEACAKLDRLAELAIGANQFTAAVKAVETKLKLLGAFNRTNASTGAALAKAEEDRIPRGLPPELAALTPPPTVAEVEHFAAVTSSSCSTEGCRVHPREAPPQPQQLH